MLRKCLHLTGSNNFNLIKHFMPNKFYTTQEDIHTTKENQADSILNKRIHQLLEKYNEEDKEKMLKIVNNISANDLLSYDISKARAKKLLSYRSSKGSLQDISEIVFVEGFGLKFSEKFYESLLSKPKTVGKQTSKVAPYVTPLIDPFLRTSIQSCVSVRVGVNSITWSKLDLSSEYSPEPCQLSDWQHHDISEKKIHLYELIARCLLVCQQIPHADCYIFENPQMVQASSNPGSVDQQNVNIQKAQVTAMVGYALASRSSSHSDDNILKPQTSDLTRVFYVRRFLAARLFNHLVGTERVSSEETVLELMRINYNVQDVRLEDTDNKTNELPLLDSNRTLRGKVNFPMNFREMFANSSRYHREYLGQSLLLNLTFVRLVLLQDPESINVVSRAGRNKTDDLPGSGEH